MPNTLGRGGSTLGLTPAVKPTQDVNYAKCGACGCSWFEEIRLARVDKNKIVILGQAVPKVSESYVLLRCGKCGELHEPTLVHGTTMPHKLYMELIAELDNTTTSERYGLCSHGFDSSDGFCHHKPGQTVPGYPTDSPYKASPMPMAAIDKDLQETVTIPSLPAPGAPEPR